MAPHDDFTNRVLLLDLEGDDDMSSLGSSYSEEDESDAESISSSKSDDDERPENFFQRHQRRSSKSKQKDRRSRHSNRESRVKLHHNYTAPDFTSAQMRKSTSKHDTCRENARWVATTTLSQMSLTPPSSKINMRKAFSLGESPVGSGNDRWNATPSSAKKPRPKITNEVLRFTADKSTETGTRWSTTLLAPELVRAKSSDSAPRTPRASLSDLKKFQGSLMKDESVPLANARWCANSTASSRSGSISPKQTSSGLTLQRRRGGKRVSAPDFSIRSVNSNENGSPNARWVSSPAKSFHSSLDLDLKRTTPAQQGSLSRWDSCSSFTAESSVISIDQLSTKPRMPKRRNRHSRVNKSNKRDESSPSTEQATGGNKPVDDGQKEEPQDTQTDVDIMSKDDPASVVSSSSSPEEEQASTEAANHQKVAALFDICAKATSTPEKAAVPQAEEISEREHEDSCIDELELGYDCLECFETIPEEEANEADEESIPGPPDQQHQVTDTLLQAPKRRKSANGMSLLLDEPEKSVAMISLSDTASLSRQSTSEPTYVQDCHTGHKRGAGKREIPYIPWDSGGGLQSVCSNSSAGSSERHPCSRIPWAMRRPLSRESIEKQKHPLWSDPNAPAMPTGARWHAAIGNRPKAYRRQLSKESTGEDEKHPLRGDATAPTMTGASLTKTSSFEALHLAQEPQSSFRHNMNTPAA